MEEEIIIDLADEEEIIIDDEDTEEVSVEDNIEKIYLNNYNYYKGEYDITPLAFQQQKLETKDKILKENVIVKEVPFFEVSNVEGTTVYIGMEV